MQEVKFDRKLSTNFRNYFPERNGIIPKVSEGRNYKEENLHYMTKPEIAKEVTDIIEQSLQNSPYFVIEICAGIGGNTLEFLSRKNVTAVMSFERDTYRSIMLQRNIMAYNLGEKSIVVNEEIKGDNDDLSLFPDAVYYFDPPWLPEDLKDAGSNYRDYYIRKNMKVGNLTLEEWLVKLTNLAYMVVFRLPDNYELKEVPGWTYRSLDLGRRGKEGKMFLCYPNRIIKGSDNEPNLSNFGGYVTNQTSLIMKLKPINPTLTNQFDNLIKVCSANKAKETACKQFVKYGFVDPEPEVRLEDKVSLKIKNKIGKPTDEYVELKDQVHHFSDIPIPTKGIELGSAEWIAEFQQYIKIILSKFIKKNDLVDSLISSDNMKTWIQAFTHESYNPDISQNYQTFEFIGDGLMKAYFKLFIYETFNGRIDQGNGSSYSSLYQSKEYQPLISQYLKLKDWALVAKVFKDDKLAEDLTESFTAALHQTGDAYKKGAGAMFVRKFVDFIGEPIIFNDVDKYGNDKQRTRQNFEGIGLKGQIVIEEESFPDKKWKFTFRITPTAVKFLQNNNFKVRDDGILAVSSIKPSKEAMRKEVWAKATQFLDSLGIDQKWFNETSSKRKWDDLAELNPKLIEKVKIKLLDDGLKGYFDSDQKGAKGIWYVYFNGENQKGKIQMLSKAENIDLNTAKLEALQKYLDSI